MKSTFKRLVLTLAASLAVVSCQSPTGQTAGKTPSVPFSTPPATSATFTTFTGSVSGGGNVLVAEYESLKTVATDENGNFTMTVPASPGQLRTFVVVGNINGAFESLTVTEGSSATQALGTIETANMTPAYSFTFYGGSYTYSPVGLVRVALYEANGHLWKRTLTTDSGNAYFPDAVLNTEYKVVASHDSLPAVTGTVRVYQDGGKTYEWTPTGGTSQTGGQSIFNLHPDGPTTVTTTSLGVIQGYGPTSDVGKTVTLSAPGLADKTAVIDANGNVVFEKVFGDWTQTIDYSLSIDGSVVNTVEFEFGNIVSMVYLGQPM